MYLKYERIICICINFLTKQLNSCVHSYICTYIHAYIHTLYCCAIKYVCISWLCTTLHSQYEANFVEPLSIITYIVNKEDILYIVCLDVYVLYACIYMLVSTVSIYMHSYVYNYM